MKTLFWIIIILLVIGGIIIKNAHDTDFNDTDDRKTFTKAMLNWGVKLGRNMIKTAGFAVKQDWKPETNTTYVVEEG